MSGSEPEGDSPRHNLRSRHSETGEEEEEEEESSEREGTSPRAARGEREEETDEADLSSIVAYLIRSGQIRFISQASDDSDTDSDDNRDFVESAKAPEPDLNPDIRDLKQSDLYAAIMRQSGRWSDHRWTTLMKPTLPNILAKRQLGMNSQHQFTRGDQCVINTKYLPNKMEYLCSYNSKAFCGSYSANGDVFLSACQDKDLRVYDTSSDKFELIKTIRARDVGWSILDTAFSPDGLYAAYSSWSDCIHLANIYGDYNTHEALNLSPGDHSFAIFSLMFSKDNREILGGANDGHLYVYDREANKRSLKIDAHDDDVNTVCFADNSSQILYSGGDDGLCKVWDRRTLREESPEAVGTLAGHSDGITFIDSKGDARFLISNSKDQSLKLWDVRCFASQTGVEETKKVVSSQRWDYRWQQFPKRMRRKREVKGDTSVMTYRGHCVLQTLIRCRFSPEANTGQRYIYTGCATGNVIVYDLLTGQVVKRLEGHSHCTRDVSWHPYKNSIISSSWDGRIGHWFYHDYDAHGEEPEGEEDIKCTKPKTFNLGGRKQNAAWLKDYKEVKFPGLFD